MENFKDYVISARNGKFVYENTTYDSIQAAVRVRDEDVALYKEMEKEERGY